MFRVRPTPSAPRVDQNYGRFAGISLPRFQRNLLQRRNDRPLPIVTARICVFSVCAITCPNDSSLHVFQLIRFPTDVDDVVDGDVATVQEADRLLVRRFPVRVGALGFRMPLVFLEHAVAFDTRDAGAAVVARCGDAIRRAGVLIDPLDLRPAFWV